ncbi:MAG: YcgN family cysteine cluster protein [Alphaproteobacteria bacterium]|nr:YcgN family cysteine cluster protein [Alphaproteobacteria bacterium]
MQGIEPEFWKHKKLDAMSKEEWELLCDGCGKCCLNKLEIKGKIKFTNTYCRFLNCKNCLCKIYAHRFEVVPDCRDIDLAAVREKPRWLPKTCAYWLLDNGYDLPLWHPLITGDAMSVHNSGNSLTGRNLVNESEVDDYENYIVDWPDL